MEKIRHNRRGCVFLLDKEVLGPGGADASGVVGSQGVGQPPKDGRKYVSVEGRQLAELS